MNPGSVERVAFRFTRKELAALLQLMGLPALPDTAVTAAEPEEDTVTSLVESGIVMACGDRTFVDGTVSLVVRNAAAGACRLTAAGPAAQRAVLYRSEKMCVLAEQAGELVTLEPLQNVPAAREPFADAVRRLARPVTVRLTDRDSGSGPACGLEELDALLDRLERL